MDWRLITKEEYDAAVIKHQPSKFVKFIYDNFSNNTEVNKNKIRKIVSITLITLFFIGFFGSILRDYISEKIIGFATYGFAGVLILLAVSLGGAISLNNRRIKKIAKELDINLFEYTLLTEKYGTL